MEIDRERLWSRVAELVRIDSVNPAFSAGTSDESVIAARVARELERAGVEVELREPAPGRVSVVARRRGTGGGRSLMLCAHLDTVGVEGMERPFDPVVRDGRLYGRGAYDMKAGLAACMEAILALTAAPASLRGDVILVATADEEVASVGMADVLANHHADAAIVTEPTELAVCVAHKGFCWIEVETYGRAAHGSRPEEGIDANLRMGRVLARLERLERELRSSSPHPLLGPPSLHAAVLQGGTGPSTYAARSRLEIERRTLPGETEASVVAEIQALLDELAADDPQTFRATLRTLLARPPFEVPADRPIVGAVERAAESVLGEAPDRIGHSYWMDAALLAHAGIDTVVIGHAGAGAHAVEEWVDLASVTRLAEVLVRAAAEFCG